MNLFTRPSKCSLLAGAELLLFGWNGILSKLCTENKVFIDKPWYLFIFKV